MARKGPFKKDLTPIGRGGVTVQRGKGARETSSDNADAVTGADQFRLPSNYAKSSPMASDPAMTGDGDADDI